jgi:uncharacterized membrane protein YadS
MIYTIIILMVVSVILAIAYLLTRKDFKWEAKNGMVFIAFGSSICFLSYRGRN